jgi:hypothetical protein
MLAWKDLQLYQIDLHFHAGTERAPEYSAADYIDFAIASGRRIIGATDHFGRFLGGSRKTLNHYPGTLEGYERFYRDIASLRKDRQETTLLFAPEIGVGGLESGAADVAFDVPVDYFIAEPLGPDGNLGDALVRSIEIIAETRRRHGRPGFLCHPLRGSVNRIVGKAGPGPKMPNCPPLPPLSSYDDPREHVEEFLDIDIGSLARASVRHRVPIELNQTSWDRMLAMNNESFLDRYLYLFQSLIDRGAEVVLGSDLHGVEGPAPTPFIAARILGVEARDIGFLRPWIG